MAAVVAAGADRVAWSHAHGVDARSLNAWRVALERRRASKRRAAVPALVELVPTSPRISAARYVVDLGAVRIELDDQCSTDTLQRVVRALRAC